MYFWQFSLHFDRDKSLEQGNLFLRHLKKHRLQAW